MYGGCTVYLTTAEVAEHYRTSPGTLRFWRHAGRGPKGVRVGKKVLYPAEEIERYDAELRAAAEHERAS
jgi:transposase-like protein